MPAKVSRHWHCGMIGHRSNDRDWVVIAVEVDVAIVIMSSNFKTQLHGEHLLCYQLL